MPEPRDPAVTEYVRTRLRQLLDSKQMTQEQVARRVGVSPAYISSVWKTGVGGRSIEGFARLFGLGNAKRLREVAYEWHLQQQPRVAARSAEPAVVEAIEDVRQLHPLVTEEQLRTILQRFSDEAFAGRERLYWFHTLLEEVKRDYMRAQAHASSAQDRARAKRSERRESELRFRKGANDRKVAKERAEAPRPAEIGKHTA